jgi:hypothetical protein
MHADGGEFLGEAMDDIEDEGAVDHRLTEITEIREGVGHDLEAPAVVHDQGITLNKVAKLCIEVQCTHSWLPRNYVSMVSQVVRAETRCFNTVPTNSLQIVARSIELTSQSRGIKSDRVGSGSSLRTWASREYFPRAEEELVPPRVVAKGEVKDERHQVADVLYRDRLGMGMGMGVGIEVGQGSSLMEKERIMKGRGSVCTKLVCTDSPSDSARSSLAWMAARSKATCSWSMAS